jgi:hypothetical protein
MLSERFRYRQYTARHNPDTAPVGTAVCADGKGLCMWATEGTPVGMDALTVAIGKHTAESGHTAFLRTVTDAVIVEPGKWDGE